MRSRQLGRTSGKDAVDPLEQTACHKRHNLGGAYHLATSQRPVQLNDEADGDDACLFLAWNIRHPKRKSHVATMSSMGQVRQYQIHVQILKNICQEVSPYDVPFFGHRVLQFSDAFPLEPQSHRYGTVPHPWAGIQNDKARVEQ